MTCLVIPILSLLRIPFQIDTFMYVHFSPLILLCACACTRTHVHVHMCIDPFPFCSVYTPFNEDEASSGGQTFLFALLNALIVVTIVVLMTVVLVLLFKYRCYRVSS